jgi:hypothetical protein
MGEIMGKLLNYGEICWMVLIRLRLIFRLANMDKNKAEIMKIFEATYGQVVLLLTIRL